MSWLAHCQVAQPQAQEHRQHRRGLFGWCCMRLQSWGQLGAGVPRHHCCYLAAEAAGRRLYGLGQRHQGPAAAPAEGRAILQGSENRLAGILNAQESSCVSNLPVQKPLARQRAEGNAMSCQSSLRNVKKPFLTTYTKLLPTGGPL